VGFKLILLSKLESLFMDWQQSDLWNQCGEPTFAEESQLSATEPTDPKFGIRKGIVKAMLESIRLSQFNSKQSNPLFVQPKSVCEVGTTPTAVPQEVPVIEDQPSSLDNEVAATKETAPSQPFPSVQHGTAQLPYCTGDQPETSRLAKQVEELQRLLDTQDTLLQQTESELATSRRQESCLQDEVQTLRQQKAQLVAHKSSLRQADEELEQGYSSCSPRTGTLHHTSNSPGQSTSSATCPSDLNSLRECDHCSVFWVQVEELRHAEKQQRERADALQLALSQTDTSSHPNPHLTLSHFNGSVEGRPEIEQEELEQLRQQRSRMDQVENELACQVALVASLEAELSDMAAAREADARASIAELDAAIIRAEQSEAALVQSEQQQKEQKQQQEEVAKLKGLYDALQAKQVGKEAKWRQEKEQLEAENARLSASTNLEQQTLSPQQQRELQQLHSRMEMLTIRNRELEAEVEVLELAAENRADSHETQLSAAQAFKKQAEVQKAQVEAALQSTLLTLEEAEEARNEAIAMAQQAKGDQSKAEHSLAMALQEKLESQQQKDLLQIDFEKWKEASALVETQMTNQINQLKRQVEDAAASTAAVQAQAEQSHELELLLMEREAQIRLVEQLQHAAEQQSAKLQQVERRASAAEERAATAVAETAAVREAAQQSEREGKAQLAAAAEKVQAAQDQVEAAEVKAGDAAAKFSQLDRLMLQLEQQHQDAVSKLKEQLREEVSRASLAQMQCTQQSSRCTALAEEVARMSQQVEELTSALKEQQTRADQVQIQHENSAQQIKKQEEMISRLKSLEKQTLEDQQAAVLQLQESSAARFEEYAIQKDTLAFQLAEQEQLFKEQATKLSYQQNQIRDLQLANQSAARAASTHAQTTAAAVEEAKKLAEASIRAELTSFYSKPLHEHNLQLQHKLEDSQKAEAEAKAEVSKLAAKLARLQEQMAVLKDDRAALMLALDHRKRGKKVADLYSTIAVLEHGQQSKAPRTQEGQSETTEARVRAPCLSTSKSTGDTGSRKKCRTPRVSNSQSKTAASSYSTPGKHCTASAGPGKVVGQKSSDRAGTKHLYSARSVDSQMRCTSRQNSQAKPQLQISGTAALTVSSDENNENSLSHSNFYSSGKNLHRLAFSSPQLSLDDKIMRLFDTAMHNDKEKGARALESARKRSSKNKARNAAEGNANRNTGFSVSTGDLTSIVSSSNFALNPETLSSKAAFKLR